jgi:hypothetical protein
VRLRNRRRLGLPQAPLHVPLARNNLTAQPGGSERRSRILVSPAFDRKATVSTLLALAALAAVAAVVASGGSAVSDATASALRCDSETIPASVTKTIALTYVDITVSGVSCSYAKKVFLIDTSKAGASPPPGWDIRITAAADGAIQDTCTRGKQMITFRFPKRA